MVSSKFRSAPGPLRLYKHLYKSLQAPLRVAISPEAIEQCRARCQGKGKSRPCAKRFSNVKIIFSNKGHSKLQNGIF